MTGSEVITCGTLATRSLVASLAMGGPIVHDYQVYDCKLEARGRVVLLTGRDLWPSCRVRAQDASTRGRVYDPRTCGLQRENPQPDPHSHSHRGLSGAGGDGPGALPAHPPATACGDHGQK